MLRGWLWSEPTEHTPVCPTCKGKGKVLVEMKRISDEEISKLCSKLSEACKDKNDKYNGIEEATYALVDALLKLQLADCKLVQAQINAAHLKEIEKLKAEKKAMIDFIERLYEFTEHADFSNGVEAFGMDEGRVRAYEWLKDWEKEWQQFKQKHGG